MSRKRRHYPSPAVDLGSFALRRFREILDTQEMWTDVVIDRATHLAVLEVKSSTGLDADQQKRLERQRAALGLAGPA